MNWKYSQILYLDNGIFKSAGRYQNLNLPHKAKYPALISRNGQIARLIIDEAHKALKHMGYNQH